MTKSKEFRYKKREKTEEWMSPKERFLRAMEGKEVDRPAVGSATSVTTIKQMERAEAYFPEAHYDRDKMFRLASQAHEELNYDVIMPYFSVWIGCAAMDVKMDWGDKTTMPEGKPPYELPSEIDLPKDYLEREPITALCDVLGKLQDEYGDKVAIMGKVMGPWTLSYHLLGTQNVLLMSRKEPEKLADTLNILKPITLEFGRKQIEAGADALCIPDHLTGDLAGPETYKKFLLEIHQDIPKKLDVPTILHICGDTLDRLKYIKQTNFDSFHLDSKVDAFEAKRVVGEEISIMGNINNSTTLLYGDPLNVEIETKYAARAGLEILGPECAIPTKVPEKNLKKITKTAEHIFLK